MSDDEDLEVEVLSSSSHGKLGAIGHENDASTSTPSVKDRLAFWNNIDKSPSSGGGKFFSFSPSLNKRSPGSGGKMFSEKESGPKLLAQRFKQASGDEPLDTSPDSAANRGAWGSIDSSAHNAGVSSSNVKHVVVDERKESPAVRVSTSGPHGEQLFASRGGSMSEDYTLSTGNEEDKNSTPVGRKFRGNYGKKNLGSDKGNQDEGDLVVTSITLPTDKHPDDSANLTPASAKAGTPAFEDIHEILEEVETDVNASKLKASSNDKETSPQPSRTTKMDQYLHNILAQKQQANLDELSTPEPKQSSRCARPTL
jgi:hypothetical protein